MKHSLFYIFLRDIIERIQISHVLDLPVTTTLKKDMQEAYENLNEYRDSYADGDEGARNLINICSKHTSSLPYRYRILYSILNFYGILNSVLFSLGTGVADSLKIFYDHTMLKDFFAICAGVPATDFATAVFMLTSMAFSNLFKLGHQQRKVIFDSLPYVGISLSDYDEDEIHNLDLHYLNPHNTPQTTQSGDTFGIFDFDMIAPFCFVNSIHMAGITEDSFEEPMRSVIETLRSAVTQASADGVSSDEELDPYYYGMLGDVCDILTRYAESASLSVDFSLEDADALIKASVWFKKLLELYELNS